MDDQGVEDYLMGCLLARLGSDEAEILRLLVGS